MREFIRCQGTFFCGYTGQSCIFQFDHTLGKRQRKVDSQCSSRCAFEGSLSSQQSLHQIGYLLLKAQHGFGISFVKHYYHHQILEAEADHNNVLLILRTNFCGHAAQVSQLGVQETILSLQISRGSQTYVIILMIWLHICTLILFDLIIFSF